jgi:hypothetical protein
MNNTETPKKSGGTNVTNVIVQLEGRLASLERIIHGMEHDRNTIRVSDSTQSSPMNRAQDIAFVIEGTELLESKAVEVDCAEHKGVKSKRQFSLKRIIRSRFFGGK